MYDRLTDRARKVIQLANVEAQRYGGLYIGSDHILLALLNEDTGIAATVLRNLNVDPDRIRREVEKLMQSGADVGVNKTPQIPKAKRVIDFAIEEARCLNHSYVGTEHMVLGLLREEEGLAAQVLISLGLSATRVRDEIVQLLGQQPVMSAVNPQSPPNAFLDLPDQIDKAVTALDELALLLSEMKKEAVLCQDFEWAAYLKDETDKLQKMRRCLLANKDREPPVPPEQRHA
jgi:ATP-dependent Clp protease ATP-binding subunit ClpA